jgi:hypothetical protein
MKVFMRPVTARPLTGDAKITPSASCSFCPTAGASSRTGQRSSPQARHASPAGFEPDVPEHEVFELDERPSDRIVSSILCAAPVRVALPGASHDDQNFHISSVSPRPVVCGGTGGDAAVWCRM